MLVVCPKCFTQYVVPDEHRLPEGQKFHCSACHHYFYLNSNGQNGFYDNETGESDVVPTVSSVMVKTEMTPIPQTPQNIVSPQQSHSAERVVPVQNHLSIKPSDIYAESQTINSNHLNEPMALLANETPQAYDRLDSLPEEFKPIEQDKKKTSSFSLIFWLCIATGICYLAYAQKDFFIQQIDKHIIGALDENHTPNNAPKSQKQDSVTTEKKESAIAQHKDEKTSTKQEVKTLPTLKEQDAPKPDQPTRPTLKTANTIEKENQTKENATIKTNKKTEIETDLQQNQKTKSVDQNKKDKPVVALKPDIEDISNTKPTNEIIKEKVVQPVIIPKSESKPISPVISQEQTNKTDESIKNSDAEIKEPIEKTNKISVEENVVPVETAIDVPQQIKPDENTVMKNASQSEIETPTNNVSETEQTGTKETTEPVVSLNPNGDESENTLNSTENILLSGEPAQPIIVRETVTVSNSYADLEPITSTLNSGTNQALKIQDISYEISENEAGMLRLLIKGSVVNTELEKTTIPELKAVVYNTEDMVVARKRIILSQPEVEGNSTQEFFSSVVPSPESVSRVEVLFDE